MNQKIKDILSEYHLISKCKCLTKESMYCEVYFMNSKVGTITLENHIYCYYPCNSIFKISGLEEDFLEKLKYELSSLFRRCS